MALINYVLALIFIYLTTVQCTTTTTIPNEDLTKYTSDTENVNAEPLMRTGRIMTIFNKEPKLSAKHLRPSHDIIRSRLDRFPSPPAGVQQRYPVNYLRHPAGHGSGPQILRRVQNNIPNGQIKRLPHNQVPRYDIVKSSRYSATKSGPQHPIGKGGPYRSHYGGSVADTVAAIASSLHHPNALTSGSAGQAPQYGHHFKPSPNFSGNVVVRPIVEQQHQPKYAQPQQHPQQQFKYPDQREQHNNFPKSQSPHQREPFPLKPSGQQLPIQQPQISYHQQPLKQVHQEPLLPANSNQQHVRFESMPDRVNALPLYSKPTPPHSYSVYEDEEQSQAKPADSNNAQEYLKFMSSNGYFLPKLDPNYKKIDDERDHQQQRQQQEYQKTAFDSTIAASAYQQQYLKQQQQQQQQPIKVSQLFFHDNPSPPASATVVRSSYQAGQLNNNNNFVVNSDGQKVNKRVVSGPQSTLSSNIPITTTTTTTTPASASYNHYYFSSSRNRTPEPVRFEFTERDAITPATYTHSPNNAQQRNSIAVGADIMANGGVGGNYIARSTAKISTTSQRTTATASYKYNDIKPVNEDDPEDGEDMQQAGSDFYGRVPVRPSLTATSPEPPSEQKDTEDYCERICSNVQDDDEEIVCGSDGFMYSSEAQMECYASCLHIDVTIQSKGSCNAS